MSIEEDKKETLNYNELVNEIEKIGYYSLPAGTVADIRFVNGEPVEIPINDRNNNPIGETLKTYDGGQSEIPKVKLIDEIMIGSVIYHSFESGETELTITSPALIESQKRLNDWLNNLANGYEISDQYIEEGHEEEHTGPVDISMYVHNHPEMAEEIQKKEKELTDERDRLQMEVNIEFMRKIGHPVPDENTLLGVSVIVNAE